MVASNYGAIILKDTKLAPESDNCWQGTAGFITIILI